MATPSGKRKEGDLSMMLTHLQAMKNDVDVIQKRVQTQALGARGGPSEDSRHLLSDVQSELFEIMRKKVEELTRRMEYLEHRISGTHSFPRDDLTSQQETNNNRSCLQTQALGARGDPSPSGDSQARVEYLEAELERTRRRLAEMMQRTREMELQLRQIQRAETKSNRSCLQDNF
jgi:hypothetical protein